MAVVHTVDGWNPAPVEVGSLSHYLQGFSTIPGGCLGFLPSTVCQQIFSMLLQLPKHMIFVEGVSGSKLSLLVSVLSFSMYPDVPIYQNCQWYSSHSHGHWIAFPKQWRHFWKACKESSLFQPGYFVVTSRHMSFLLIGMRNSKHLQQQNLK